MPAYDDDLPGGESPGELPERPSKSAKKREAHALVELADTLVNLSNKQLAAIPLDEELQAAIAEARRLNKGARKRQLKYLGKLLRGYDTEPIQKALQRLFGVPPKG